jgi:hypothetical protein
MLNWNTPTEKRRGRPPRALRDKNDATVFEKCTGATTRAVGCFFDVTKGVGPRGDSRHRSQVKIVKKRTLIGLCARPRSK